MLKTVSKTANKTLFGPIFRRYSIAKSPLSDRWQTDPTIIMNTFARRKTISGRYGIEGKLDDKPVTHVSMNPPRKFHVAKEENEAFLREYSRAIVEQQYMTLLELPTVYSPLRIDVDVEKMDALDKVITEDLIENLMSLYAEESLKYLAVPSSKSTEELLTAYVLQRKKNYVVDSNSKEGLHAIFPDVVFPTNLHNKLLHRPVAERAESMFSETQEGKFKIVVDQIGKNPWFMIGSQKHCDLYPYTVEYVWKYGEKLMPFTLSMNSESEIFQWVSKFSIRHKNVSEFSKETSEDLNKKILSIKESGEDELSLYNARKLKSFSSQSQPGFKASSSQFQINENYRSRKQQTFSGKQLDSLFKDLENLIDLYDAEIADSYRSWSSIGFAMKILCHYYDDCDNDFREIWFTFSKKSPKFDQVECEKKWISFDASRGELLLAKRILLKYANQCDISEKYRSFIYRL